MYHLMTKDATEPLADFVERAGIDCGVAAAKPTEGI
jgi:hypothetical protein